MQRGEIMSPCLPAARAGTLLLKTIQDIFAPASTGSAVNSVRESPSQVGHSVLPKRRRI